MMPRAKLAMAMFLISEAVFFFMLIAAFVYFHPSAAVHLELNFGEAAVVTVCLVASCFTMGCAATSTTRNNTKTARAWLAATILLGIAFLVAQGDASLSLRALTWGAALFTLTGCHELHVAVGILMLGGALLFETSELGSVAVQTVALYWYFVVAVWIAIFSTVYLWSFL